jgi:type I protein arginine methyltransferase
MGTYSLSGYTSMLGDPVRVDAYEAALRQAITPGCTVLEIGTGTGFFAVLAARMGAGIVHAVEPDDSIQVARDMARDNGVLDRIVFHQELSTRVTLEHPADVLFSDLRGVLPLFQHHVATVRDARSRLLRPGGVQIPLRDRVWAAPVCAAETWRDRTAPWGEAHRGLDLAGTSRRLANLWSKARLKPEQLAAPPARWAELDWTRIEEPAVRGTLRWTLETGGPVHGIGAWFETDLLDGPRPVGFTNAPDAPEALYGHAFFPFPAPLDTAAGDTLELDLRAHLVGDDYVWEWRTHHIPEPDPGQDAASPAGSATHTRTRTRTPTKLVQSTLAGTVLTPHHFRRGGDGYLPRLGPEGRIDAFVLGAMDGTATVGDIAHRLHAAFPEQFPDYRAALSRVSALSRDRAE